MSEGPAACVHARGSLEASPPPEDLLPRRRGQQKVAASGPHAARHSPPRLPPRGGSRGSGGSWFGLRKVGLPVQKPVNVAAKPGAGPRCGSPARARACVRARAMATVPARPAHRPGKAAPPRGRPRSLSSRGTCLAQGPSSFLHCYLAAQLVLPKAGRAGWGEGGRVRPRPEDASRMQKAGAGPPPSLSSLGASACQYA